MPWEIVPENGATKYRHRPGGSGHPLHLQLLFQAVLSVPCPMASRLVSANRQDQGSDPEQPRDLMLTQPSR